MEDLDQIKHKKPNTSKQNSSEGLVTKQTAHSEGHVGKRAGKKKSNLNLKHEKTKLITVEQKKRNPIAVFAVLAHAAPQKLAFAS